MTGDVGLAQQQVGLSTNCVDLFYAGSAGHICIIYPSI